jgi:acetyltransferase-like isoleucine patch superfamily enzyme
MNLSKYFSKHEFPLHLRVIYKVLSSRLSEIISTILFTSKMRFYGNSYGKNLCIIGKVIVDSPRKRNISIGDNFTLVSRFMSNLVGITNICVLQCLGSGTITIGSNCGFSSPIISAKTSVIIGDHVLIGANVRIYDHDYHSTNFLTRRSSQQDKPKTKSIHIEDDVFIGTNSIILKGSHIGARTVIGAGSVCSNMIIPPDSIVAGNPAKMVKRTHAEALLPFETNEDK